MGLKFSKSAKNSSLVQPAISGNDELIKSLIGRHIASYINSEVCNSKFDPRLQSYVNATDAEGNTPLIGAVYGGHLEIVSFLIEKCGADMTIKNDVGCSPIWVAAGYSKLAILEYLIDSLFKKEDRNARNICNILSEKNNSGDSPFLAAVSKGYIDILKLLFNSMDKLNIDESDIVNSYKWNLLCEKNKASDTPLSVAVGAGCDCNMELLKFLLDQEESCIVGIEKNNEKNLIIGRPLNAKNSKGLTPILVACERNNVAVLEELRKRGPIFTEDSNGRSPLAIASFCGCVEVTQYLLSIEAGKEMLDHKDNNGCTAVWLAARTGNLVILKLLVDAGADLSLDGIDGLSVMDVAKKYKKGGIVDYLVQLGNK